MLLVPFSKTLSIKLNKDSRKLYLFSNGFKKLEAKLQRNALFPNFQQLTILRKIR